MVNLPAQYVDADIDTDYFRVLCASQKNARPWGRAFWLAIQEWLDVGLVVVAAVTIAITVAAIPHVVHRAAIAFLEAFAEVALGFVSADGRMSVHTIVVGISVAAVLEIATGGFHAFVKALTLGIAVVVGIAIPVAIATLILILGRVLRVGGRRWLLCGSLDGDRGGHAESKSGN